MPGTPNVSTLRHWTNPARRNCRPPARAMLPTMNSDPAMAVFSSCPSRKTRTGTVRIDPPEPRRPRLRPIAIAPSSASKESIKRSPRSDRVERDLQVTDVVIFGLRETTGTKIHLQGRQDELGHAELTVSSFAQFDESVARNCVIDMDVACALFSNTRFPGVDIATGCLVV